MTKKTIAAQVAESTPESVRALFAYYAQEDKTLADTLHEFRTYSEHTLRACLKRTGSFAEKAADPLYETVDRADWDAVNSKFFTKRTANGEGAAQNRMTQFEKRNKILTTAFHARLAYNKAMDDCRKAGMDDEQIRAFFSLFSEGDFDA